jgi:glycosyltransferase involved in cell wall biosynthesis
MISAVYFHPEAYSTTGERLMGRNAAGESFLRGLITYSSSSVFGAVVSSSDHANGFVKTVRDREPTKDIRTFQEYKLNESSCPDLIFYPGPNISKHAYQRSAFGSTSWSLCGITHTTSSEAAMDALANILIAPLHSWDAVICPSSSVKRNALCVIDAQRDYLKSRLGATDFELPELPVIPLGIHTEDFEFSDAQRISARASIGADNEAIVVTYMGRLSFHAKAHPLAMYQALERAAGKSGKQVILIECGWHPNQYIKDAFEQAATMVCPSVRHIHLDGRQQQNRDAAWASADVFCSFSDNIQETFGITPLEAMATGVPVVVTDWDGYRDSVRDGVDGFRIPTMMPGPDNGADLAMRHALGTDTYDRYCGMTSSMISVDIDLAAEAFTALFVSSELRATMGAAGRDRAKQIYDWKTIIPSYEALWTELNQRRLDASEPRDKNANVWPARLDPFYSFEHYATSSLKPETVLALVDEDAKAASARYQRYLSLKMVNYNTYTSVEESLVFSLFEVLETGPLKAGNLLEEIDAHQDGFVFRFLAALLKLGLLKIQK